MANTAAGSMRCPMCEEVGELRRYKNHERGKLYLSCACGQIRPALNQGYILRNGEFLPGALAPTAAEIAAARADYAAKKKTAPVTETDDKEPVNEKPTAHDARQGAGRTHHAPVAPTKKPVNEPPPPPPPTSMPAPTPARLAVKADADATPEEKASEGFGGFF